MLMVFSPVTANLGRPFQGFLDGDQAGWVRDEVVEVLHLLRPMAVSLVDAW